MDSLMKDLSIWFSERPQWFQIAATQLFEQTSLTENDISGIAIICQQEAEGVLHKTTYPFPAIFSNNNSGQLHISSIGNIEGVNALAPRQPLEFGSNMLSIVYGMNGTGKSGYVRILKHVCGVRDPGILHPNIFDIKSKRIPQKASIKFKQDNIEKTYVWNGYGVCSELCGVDIFDSCFDRFLVKDGSEVGYEPSLLSFFSSLIDLCGKVSSNLDAEANRHRVQKNLMPSEMKLTEEGQWYDALSITSTSSEIDEHCTFNGNHEATLQDLQQRFSEQDPAEKAKHLKTMQQHSDAIVSDFKKYSEQLSDVNSRKIIECKGKWILAKEAANIAAKKISEKNKLEGIDSEVWRELWEAARKYSLQLVYRENSYPNISDGARCVLCHQILSSEAKERFISLDNFVKGETQKYELSARIAYETAIQECEALPEQESLRTRIDAAGMQEDDVISALLELLALLQSRREALLAHDGKSDFPELSFNGKPLERLKEHSESLKKLAEKYTEDAVSGNKIQLGNSIQNLRAKKWLFENRTSINNYMEHSKKLANIENAKKLTRTTAISQKKGELSETLITEAFIQRFSEEMHKLGASHIKIELKKTTVSKGRVLHKIQLKGTNHNNITDVLSEGEMRIISIAAFLADAAGKTYRRPFVFDDPISSLDQNFEEAVVQRLLEFSRDRQVIVFTHRLSLLGTVMHYSDKYSVKPDVQSIRFAEWGTGEPSPLPLLKSDMKKSLNLLIQKRIPDAKEANSAGKIEYCDILIRLICSEFRTIIERSIEVDLLHGIVERFKRPISSLKLRCLSHLRDDDWRVLDSLMTKYSFYEHSQPMEAPINLPTPDDLLTDMLCLKKWREEYSKRAGS